jgi:hypothetical protein
MAGPIVAGLLWGTFGAPVLLVSRMAMALGAEVFTWRMTRNLKDEPSGRRLRLRRGPAPASRPGQSSSGSVASPPAG